MESEKIDFENIYYEEKNDVTSEMKQELEYIKTF